MSRSVLVPRSQGLWCTHGCARRDHHTGSEWVVLPAWSGWTTLLSLSRHCTDCSMLREQARVLSIGLRLAGNRRARMRLVRSIGRQRLVSWVDEIAGG